jgi:aspartate aminotransferase
MKKLSTAAQNIDGQPMFKYLDRARKLEAEGRSMIHMEIGDPDFSTPPNITMAAVRALTEGKTHYTSSWGDLEFRETIRTATYNSRGFMPDLNQVLVVPGANVGIYYAVFCLCDPGEEVLVPDPGFATYYSSIKMCGVNAVRVPLKEAHGFRMQADDVRELITDKTRLLILNSPNNPTGAVMTKEELKAIYDLCVEKDIYLYSDEIYSRMIYDDYEFTSPAQYDQCKSHVILSNGFSKAFAMTGWRIGYIGAPEFIAKACTKMQGQVTSGANSIAQRATIKAVDADPKVLNEMVTAFKKRRDLVVDLATAIPGLKINSPEGAFYLFPDVSSYFGKTLRGKLINNADDLSMYLLSEANVATVTGDAFGNPNCIRISYATSEKLLREAFNRIKEALT